MSMSETAKLVQYLGEAYGKERELETALEDHIIDHDQGSIQKTLETASERDKEPRQTA